MSLASVASGGRLDGSCSLDCASFRVATSKPGHECGLCSSSFNHVVATGMHVDGLC
jgi:hypothetical protein